MSKANADAVVVLDDGPILHVHRARIAALAIRERLPSIYPRREAVEADGLLAYGTDRREQFRRLAVYVDRILKRAKPGDLPVDQPTKFELIINLRTARALGLTIAPPLLHRADEVIE